MWSKIYYLKYIQGDSRIVSDLCIYKNIITYFDTFDLQYCFIFLKSDYCDHKIVFKLKNSKVFYERVIYIAGIKVLSQTLFVNHLVYTYMTIYSLLEAIFFDILFIEIGQ
jgi:hypothetical protein